MRVWENEADDIVILLVLRSNRKSQESEASAGFQHNSVSPFGSIHTFPIIMAANISKVAPAFIWMGGGHTDLKLGMSLTDVQHELKPIVADVSDPREESDRWD